MKSADLAPSVYRAILSGLTLARREPPTEREICHVIERQGERQGGHWGGERVENPHAKINRPLWLRRPGQQPGARPRPRAAAGGPWRLRRLLRHRAQAALRGEREGAAGVVVRRRACCRAARQAQQRLHAAQPADPAVRRLAGPVTRAGARTSFRSCMCIQRHVMFVLRSLVAQGHQS